LATAPKRRSWREPGSGGRRRMAEACRRVDTTSRQKFARLVGTRSTRPRSRTSAANPPEVANRAERFARVAIGGRSAAYECFSARPGYTKTRGGARDFARPTTGPLPLDGLLPVSRGTPRVNEVAAHAFGAGAARLEIYSSFTSWSWICEWCGCT